MVGLASSQGMDTDLCNWELMTCGVRSSIVTAVCSKSRDCDMLLHVFTSVHLVKEYEEILCVYDDPTAVK
jgi:hypothetical protein